MGKRNLSLFRRAFWSNALGVRSIRFGILVWEFDDFFFVFIFIVWVRFFSLRLLLLLLLLGLLLQLLLQGSSDVFGSGFMVVVEDAGEDVVSPILEGLLDIFGDIILWVVCERHVEDVEYQEHNEVAAHFAGLLQMFKELIPTTIACTQSLFLPQIMFGWTISRMRCNASCSKPLFAMNTLAPVRRFVHNGRRNRFFSAAHL